MSVREDLKKELEKLGIKNDETFLAICPLCGDGTLPTTLDEFAEAFHGDEWECPECGESTRARDWIINENSKMMRARFFG